MIKIPILHFADLNKWVEQQADFFGNLKKITRLWRQAMIVIEKAKEMRDWKVQENILNAKEQSFAIALSQFELLAKEIENEK